MRIADDDLNTSWGINDRLERDEHRETRRPRPRRYFSGIVRPIDAPRDTAPATSTPDGEDA